MKPAVATWLRFNVVAVAGFAVQSVVLELMLRVVGPHYLAGSIVAVEAAVLHNFAWHRRWTWASRAASEGSWRLFLRFQTTQGLWSLTGTAMFMPLLVGAAGLPVQAANLASTALCGVLSLVNFFVLDRYVFRPCLGRRCGV